MIGTHGDSFVTAATGVHSSLDIVRAQRLPRMGKSTRIASLLEDDSGLAKASWNLEAILSSGVLLTMSSGLPSTGSE